MTDRGTAVADVWQRIAVLDVDTHVTEPPDLWTCRVSSKWGELVPHVVPDPTSGHEVWRTGNTTIPKIGTHSSAGWTEPHPFGPPTFAQIARGAWEPKARLEWMDEHGIFAQLLYPNLLGFNPQVFAGMEPALGLACVRAWNDFQADFCSEAPDRLFGLAYLPWWDLDESMIELTRCHDLGHKGLNFGWEFDKFGLPPLRSDHWEPLLRTVEDMGWSVNFHVGFNGLTEDESAGLRAIRDRDDSLELVSFGTTCLSGNMRCITELILGRICHKYPTLKFVSVESGCGYLPYLVATMDWHFKNTAARGQNPDLLLPSEYFKRQIYGTFWFEEDIERCVELFPDNIMFESDYPHPTSLSPGPNTYALGPRDTIAANLADMPQDLLAKVLHDNAAAVYGL